MRFLCFIACKYCPEIVLSTNVSSQRVIVTYGNHVEAFRGFCKIINIELVYEYALHPRLPS